MRMRSQAKQQCWSGQDDRSKVPISQYVVKSTIMLLKKSMIFYRYSVYIPVGHCRDLCAKMTMWRAASHSIVRSILYYSILSTSQRVVMREICLVPSPYSAKLLASAGHPCFQVRRPKHSMQQHSPIPCMPATLSISATNRLGILVACKR